MTPIFNLKTLLLNRAPGSAERDHGGPEERPSEGGAAGAAGGPVDQRRHQAGEEERGRRRRGLTRPHRLGKGDNLPN